MPATLNRKWILILSGIALALIFALFFSSAAHAQSAEATQKVESLLDLIQGQASNWGTSLYQYAESMFWSLALIQFIWTFFPLVIRNADFGEIVGELIKYILIIGFFYFLLTESTALAQAIVDSFRQAGGVASGRGEALEPGSMFGVAIDMALTVLQGAASATPTIGDWFSDPVSAASDAIVAPFAQLGAFFAALLIGVCFAFIAAFMFVTLVESYIVINAAVLFMGFGGSQWTREYALAMVRYAMSVGAKLFVLTLLVGLVIQSAEVWKEAYTDDAASMLTLVGLSLVCAYLSKQIPDLVQGLITGTSLGGGAAVGSMATMAVAAAAGAAGAAAAAAGSGGAAAAGGSAAGGGGAAGGSGGLASALSNSISGGPSAGYAPGGSASGGGGGASPATALTPRIGGGASAAPSSGPSGEGGAMSPPSASGSQDSDSGGGRAGDNAQENGAFEETATSEADAMAASPDYSGDAPQAASSPSAAAANTASPDTNSNGEGEVNPSPAPKSKVEQMAKGAQMLASTAGIMGAISVPGMEGAGAGNGSAPRQGEGGKSQEGEFKTKSGNAGSDSNPPRNPPPVASPAPKKENKP